MGLFDIKSDPYEQFKWYIANAAVPSIRDYFKNLSESVRSEFKFGVDKPDYMRVCLEERDGKKSWYIGRRYIYAWEPIPNEDPSLTTTIGMPCLLLIPEPNLVLESLNCEIQQTERKLSMLKARKDECEKKDLIGRLKL